MTTDCSPRAQATESSPDWSDELAAMAGNVGPGWAPLVARAWRAARAAGSPVSEVVERWGALHVHCVPAEAVGSDALWTLYWTLVGVERESLHVCEGCGGLGRPYYAGETVGPATVDETKTLCPVHAWAFYVDRERAWRQVERASGM